MLSLVLLMAASSRNPAPTPPMGWNSYDCFGYSVTEAQVKENAQYMLDHLRQYGWEYVVIDYVWASPKLKNLDPAPQDGHFEPRLAMDEYGRLIPDLARFPSSQGGKGFRPLADWLHNRGLKFGIHLMRGIPRQAVGDNTPILGSSAHAADAANQKSPCPWNNHMWGMNMAQPAGQEYLDSIFRLYADWEVDFVKVDDLSNPYSAAEVEGYWKAIDRCGRPIVLSLSPGPTPIEDAAHVNTHANMWRLLGDLWDNWDQLDNAFEAIAAWSPHRKAGHWPDPDMLPLGRLRVYGPPTGPPDTQSRFTHDEIRTLMSLWCIGRCPLMFGGNLPQTDPFTLAAITNRSLIEIDQHSANNRPLAGGETPVWTADSTNPKVKYLALFNRSERPLEVRARLSDLGIAVCRVYDIWSGASSKAEVQISRTVPAHGVALLALTILKAAPVTHPLTAKPNLSGIVYEAESPENSLTGETHAVADPTGKCSAGKLVKNIGLKPENVLRFNHVMAPADGEYVLTVAYMSGERRRMGIGVNGSPAEFYTFYQTGGWDGRYLGYREVRVHLKAGDNTIELGNPTAWGVDVDRIIVRK